ncbi:MAG: HNH endonuclease signature motif containing protein, partial [Streptosporangiaceae bacterium]
PGPPGGYGTWRFTTGIPGQRAWIIDIDPIPAGDCDHRYQATGHDPGVKLRHLTRIRHATCTGPMCECPSGRADFEHNIPYDKGGRTCLCNTGPKCRHDHRLKQESGWNVEQHPDGTFTWTTPAGRTYTTGPTEYPI